MITLGIDVGTLTTKALILEDRNILSFFVLPTGNDISGTTANTIDETLKKACLSLNQISQIVATGVGKNHVPYPAKTAAEIRCDTAGAIFLHPSVKGLIDLGADNCRVVKCGPKGNVVDFALNDRCAAGTGIFLDAMAKILQITPKELRDRHKVEHQINIVSTCVVFAESEVVSQIHKGDVNRFSLWKAINNSLAKRIHNLIARLHIIGETVIIGGHARNADLIACLEEIMGSKLLVPSNPQIVCALGAAIIARG